MATSSMHSGAAVAPSYLAANGGSPPRNHYRRPSLKRTFMPISPGVSARRTHCPKDVDAFSFSPSHLPAWNMPQDLWASLPDRLRPHIVSMQHAGAAVLTGFERLEEIRTTLLADCEESSELQGHLNASGAMESNILAGDELNVLLSNINIDTLAKGPRSRHDSLATPALCTPSLTPSGSEVSDRSADSSMLGTPGDSSPVTPASPPTILSPFNFPADIDAAAQQFHTPPPPTSPPAASLVSPTSTPETEMPCSPTNTPATPSSPSSTSSILLSPLRPFTSPPRHPRATYYAAEMAELRCVALVRLRHAARRVDAEWGECKRVGVVRPSERDPDARMNQDFELWWSGRKGAIIVLEERVRRAEKLGLGSTGLE